MKNLYFVILTLFLFNYNTKAQKIILEDNVIEINSLVKLDKDKAIISCKIYSPYAIVQPNALKMYTVNNLTNFSLTQTIDNLAPDIVSWSHHAIFLNKPDTITVITNYLNTTDTTVGLAVLFLNYNLKVIKKQFYKFNLPFKYPGLKNSDIVPFNVKANGSKGYYGTTTIINSKNNSLWSIGAPVVEVLFDLDENLNLKVMKNIVSDSVELGDDFFLKAFNVLGLMKTKNGYRLQGEHSLAFNLDSVFNITNHTYTQPWESNWMLDGSISYRKTKWGYQSVAIQLTDSSNINNFPESAVINRLNLLRLRNYDNNANILDERLMRLPNQADSAEVRIWENSTVIYENNLQLSNLNLESFNTNNNGEAIYGYYPIIRLGDLSSIRRYSLILFDSTLNLKNANTFYEERTTLINSILLEDNGNIWVSGYHTGTIPTKNYLRLITKAAFYTGLPSFKNQETKINIYPNPASNYINTSTLPLNSILNIYDLSGRVLKSTTSTQNNNLSIVDLETGIYLIELITPNGKIARSKFVVSR